MYICKYCGKQCKNKNSLAQHEVRCKSNPDSITIRPHKKTCRKGINLGRIWVNNGKDMKFIRPDELPSYSNMGWIRGFHSEYKRKISDSLIGRTKGVASTKEKEIERRKKISQTMKKNPNSGGKRVGSGRGKKGWYKGFFCDSSWELAFVLYHLDNGLYIERCNIKRRYIFNNTEHHYFPDFITDDGIVEIKGYNTEQWQSKLEQNSDIIVLYEPDMKKYIDYAINKYGKDYIRLYE